MAIFALEPGPGAVLPVLSWLLSAGALHGGFGEEGGLSSRSRPRADGTEKGEDYRPAPLEERFTAEGKSKSTSQSPSHYSRHKIPIAFRYRKGRAKNAVQLRLTTPTLIPKPGRRARSRSRSPATSTFESARALLQGANGT
jgi:hypothetical protein